MRRCFQCHATGVTTQPSLSKHNLPTAFRARRVTAGAKHVLQNVRKNCSKAKYLAPVAANSYSTLERFHPVIPLTSAGRAMRLVDVKLTNLRDRSFAVRADALDQQCARHSIRQLNTLRRV